MNRTDYIMKRLSEKHKDKVIEHFINLDSEMLYSRFRTTMKKESIENYVNKLNFQRDGFFGIFDNDLNIIGFGECILQENGDHAELGFTIDTNHQGVGLGSSLMSRLVRFAKSQNKHILEMECFRNNQKTVHMAKKFGLNVHSDGGESIAEINMEDVKPELENFNEKVEDTFAHYALQQKEQLNSWNKGQKMIAESVLQVINTSLNLIKPRKRM